MDASNIQEFAGLLTRATTRPTPYSIFASIETTRLTSSLPVTAITMSARSTPACSRTSGLEPTPLKTVPAGSFCSRRSATAFLDSMTLTVSPRLPSSDAR